MAGMRIGDIASPQRMGAALTYARRYALFTLVGIAGEDDLDAPDVRTPRDAELGRPTEPNGRSEPRGHGAPAPVEVQFTSVGCLNYPCRTPPPSSSPFLRGQLLSELGAIATADEAAVWAKRSLPAKNTLTPADADVIEQAFGAKMQSVERMETDQAAAPPPSGDQCDNFDAQHRLDAPIRIRIYRTTTP
jgi:hypothetical protein